MEQWAAVGAEECMRPVIGGKWVRYDDAQRAIAEAERRVHDHYGSIQQGYLSGYEQGQRDMLARCVAAAEADVWLPKPYVVTFLRALAPDGTATTTCPAHGPLDESGGCAGCVAEDRATDAWEGE